MNACQRHRFIDPLRSARLLRSALPWALALPASLVLATSAWAGGTPATGTVTDQLQTMGGGGALASVGDDISSTATGLDAPYFFYVEVPVGATDLQVDIFDADILAGAGDIAGERDQNRDLAGVVNTSVRYRLYDPSGNLVAARFNFGDDVTPPSSDNTWLKMYDSDTAGITGGDTFADNFSSAAYSNNDGNLNFVGDWIESNDDGDTTPGDTTDDATTGDVLITGNALRLANQSDATSNFTNQPSVEREVDLSTYAAAVVTFDYSTGTGVDIISNGGDSGDSFSFDVSNDGGSTWVILDEFGNLSGATSGSATYDISDYLASNTRVRLRITNRYAGTSETVDIDNFQIRAVTTANGGAPDAGHWQLEVDMSGTVNGEIAGIRTRRQDDVNAFGIRAHDGTPGSGGTEYNLYADSYVIVGINDNDRSRDYDLYPYVTLGCDGNVNDFDFDANQPNPSAPNTNIQPFGSVALTTRSGLANASSSTMSDNDAWNSLSFTAFNFDDNAANYGIWTMAVTIDDWEDNNYGPIYVGNEDAAAPAPTASPEADTFRIYFPTDAGAAPAKPFVSQYLNYVNDQSAGPNPPGVGQTSTFAVTVLVSNPTGSIGDITFSNTNVVSANLSATTETEYGGLAFVTAGSIVSQPTVGATSGAITWNPGTLSPGDTESMVYYVDISPAAATDIVVTGTSGSGIGTQATFLDETDTSFTFGELCRLVMSASSLTPVLVSDFATEVVDDTVVVSWQTAAEAQTLAMDLYRLTDDGKVKVNDGRLPAFLGRPQGGTYRFADPAAPLDAPSTYVLVETESNGHQKTHGPFTVLPQSFRESSDVPNGLQQSPHPTPAELEDRLAAARDVTVVDQPQIGGNLFQPAVGALRLIVDETGVYRLTATELADAFGVEQKMVERLLSQRRLRLSVQGQEVPWRKIGRSTALEFYGEAIDSPFTSRQVYRLEVARGTVIPEPIRTIIPPDWTGETFTDTIRFEGSELPVVLMDLDPESDNWFWGYVSPSALTRDLSASLDSPVSGEDATLKLDLQGAAEGDHQLVIRWNGQEIGQVAVTDQDSTTAELSFDSQWLSEGDNTLRVELLSGDLVFIDGFDLSYERRLESVGDVLTVRGLDAEVLSASAFSSTDARVYDVSDPKAPRLLPFRTLPESGGYRLLWQGRSGGPFAVVAEAGVMIPGVEEDTPSDLRGTGHQVDYLVITTADMLAAAQTLADYRAGQGLSTLVVDVQDVYDEFAHGLRDVRAIRDFLAYTQEHWQGEPRMVVLAGAGTYDYHDHYGLGGNRIPVLLASTGESLFASDSALADFDADGTPDIAIGRIPALIADELTAYVDKIQAYEAADSPIGSSHVMILSDHADENDDFAAAGDALKSLLPAGFETTHVRLDDTDLATARQMVQDSLTDGTAWLHFTGHGGVDRMSASGLLTSADAQTLSNSLLPIVSSVTCHINYHALPGFDSLGEYLVLRPDAGAAAVLAPAWLARHSQAQWVGDRLFRGVFQSETDVLGDALLQAIDHASQVGAPAGVLGTFQLLGDPALRIKAEPGEVTPTTCEPNCGGPG